MHFRVVPPEALPNAVLLVEPPPRARRVPEPEHGAGLVAGQDGERDAVAPVGREAALARADGGDRILDMRPLPGRLELERGRELLRGQREAEREAEDVRAWVRIRAAPRPERDRVVREGNLLFEGHFVLVDASAEGERLVYTVHVYGAREARMWAGVRVRDPAELDVDFIDVVFLDLAEVELDFAFDDAPRGVYCWRVVDGEGGRGFVRFGFGEHLSSEGMGRREG